MPRSRPRPPDNRRRPPRRPASARTTPGPEARAGWDHVAAWYDKLVGDEGSDYHRNVILPAALRLLDIRPGERVLDLCCGQGVLTRAFLDRDPAFVLGVDASPRLIAAARERGPRTPRVRFVVRDAARLDHLADGAFHAAALVMAAQDLPELPPVCGELARALRPGGRAVLVLMHPCFRIPRQSEWGWDEAKQTRYRRIDRYYEPLTIPIATHPGRDPGQKTDFYHRPLADYINGLAAAGLATVHLEELLSHRRAEPGGRSRGENRAAAEIPVFLALRAVKLSPNPDSPQPDQQVLP